MNKITQLSHCYATYCSILGQDTGAFDSYTITVSKTINYLALNAFNITPTSNIS